MKEKKTETKYFICNLGFFSFPEVFMEGSEMLHDSKYSDEDHGSIFIHIIF